MFLDLATLNILEKENICIINELNSILVLVYVYLY